MAKYRKIDPKIWNDLDFRRLSDSGKLVFLFVLTHPSMTSLGAMRATMEGLASELGWSPKAFREAFGEGFAKGMLEADENASYVGAPNFVKYNQPESPNVVKAWVGALDLIPECELRNRLLQRVNGFLKDYPEAFREGFGKAFAKAMAKAMVKTMPNPEQEQEQEQEQDNTPQPPLGGGVRDTGAAKKTGNEFPGFDRFWDAWPRSKRKTARSQCRDKWRTQDCEPIAGEIIAAVETMKRDRDWTKDEGQFIPSPLVWLNQRRWDAVQRKEPRTAQNTIPPSIAFLRAFQGHCLADYVAEFLAEYPKTPDSIKNQLRLAPETDPGFRQWVQSKKSGVSPETARGEGFPIRPAPAV